jgi:hypothetical protein
LANDSVFTQGDIKFRIKYDDDSNGALNGWAFSKAVTLTALNGPIPITIDGFVDFYDPSNWTIDDVNAHGGSVDVSGAPGSVTLRGPDDGSRTSGEISYLIQAPVGGIFSFDWAYSSTDPPGYDFAYSVNGYDVFLSTSNGDSGNVSVHVNAGDWIGWRVYSNDSVNGPGVLTISNFSAPGLIVPEPTGMTVALFGATICGGAFCRLRRGRSSGKREAPLSVQT